VFALRQSGIYKQLGQLLGGQNPAEALATTTYNLLEAVLTKLGGKVPIETIPSIGIQCLSIMAELGESGGAHEVSQQLVGQATQLMLQRFMKESGIDPNEVGQQLSQSKDIKTAPSGAEPAAAPEEPEGQ